MIGKSLSKAIRLKTLLLCRIDPDEYNRILAYELSKEILDCLRTTNEGTIQVQESKIDMLTNQCEAFTMKEIETIQEIHTKFTTITNELHYLGEVILSNDQVRKILSVLPKSQKSMVNVTSEDRDLKTLYNRKTKCTFENL